MATLAPTPKHEFGDRWTAKENTVIIRPLEDYQYTRLNGTTQTECREKTSFSPVDLPVAPSRPVEPTSTEGYREKSSIAYELSKLPFKTPRRLKVIVVGAGVSALSLAHDVRVGRLQHIDLHILEKNAGLGGTWFENRYPGCACDVPSHNYLVSIRSSN